MGRGCKLLPDGRRLEGDFERSMLNGHGMVAMPDGSRLIGTFVDDKEHGEITYKYED